EAGLVFPRGSDASRRVNIRLVAATKADLQGEVRAGRMREDFYHRIAVLTLDVPPLRDRRDDIPMLLAHFLAQAASRNALAVPTIPDATLAAALDDDWPGNVRELRNAAERIFITAPGGVAGPLPVGGDAAGDDDAPRLLSVPPGPGRLREELERTEQAAIEQALAETGGEVTSACRALGISRRALYERMKKYGLRREDFRDEG
ncbi:MAG: sigma 54-interacting transcriptional regulator, partial [Deltaproteobacteria bacterium]|nr:sigma 54-interacting transcriptional regulator [Deltaproteobacteria bacterium]